MRGLPFDLAAGIIADPNFKWKIDDRWDYGEIRHVGYGSVDGKRHCLCWTPEMVR